MGANRRKGLAILCAVKSGVVTVYREYDSLPPRIMQKIATIDGLISKAIKVWMPDEFDDDDDRIVVDLLEVWKFALTQSGLYEEINMTTMISISQQACQALIATHREGESRLVMPIVVELDDLAHHLHDGLKDEALIKRFEMADLILEKLYKITGFNYER